MNEAKMTREQLEAALEAMKATRLSFPFVRRNSRGQEEPVGCCENTEALLKHNGIVVRYNEMTKAMEIDLNAPVHADKSLNDAITLVRDCARKEGYSPTVAEENLGPISSKHAYHPARDWILSKEWDGKDRLTELLATVETEEGDDYKRLLIGKWLVAAVALLFYDTEHQNDDHRRFGFKGVEGILVFQGKQGKGKTRWLESLVPARSQWVKDAVTLDPHNKDSVLLAVSHWIVELGEIDATFRKSDVAALKGFATQKSDKLRPAYAKAFDTYARRTAFTGTVNDLTFLAESGESRRWWTLEVKAIDSNHAIDIQQLWAQVYDLYMQCVPYWLSEEERTTVYRNNSKFEQVDPVIEQLHTYLRNPLMLVDSDHEPAGTAGVELLGASAIGRIVLNRECTKADANKISQWLTNRGFQRSAETKKFRVKIDHAGLQLSRERHNYLFSRTTS